MVWANFDDSSAMDWQGLHFWRTMREAGTATGNPAKGVEVKQPESGSPGAGRSEATESAA